MRSAIKCGGNVLANLDAKEVFLNAVPHVERQRPIYLEINFGESNMKKLFKLLPLVAVVALAACNKPEDKKVDAAKPEAAASNGEIIVKIGSGAPKSGGIAHLGQDNEMGAQLAINEINAKGDLMIGGKKIKLELVGEDDGGDAKQGTTVAQKLVDAKVVGVVGHLNSGVSMPANAIYAGAGIVQVSPSSTNPDYTIKGKKTPGGAVTAYRVVANDIQQGSAIGKYAVEKGAKTIAILDDATQYGKGLADYVEKTVVEKGAKVTSREALTDKTTDFKGTLNKIKSQNPDYIFWGGMDDTAAALVKQMRELGMKTKLITGDGACTAKFIELSGASGEGTTCSQAGAPVSKMAKGADFIANYEKTFPGKRVEIYSPFAYDAVYAIVNAMKAADSIESEKIAAAMSKVTFDGLIGKIAFDEKGDIKGGIVTIQEVKAKKLEVITTVQ
jgi:branched-chain amino acid transport system substrate-binding protein